MLLSALLLHLIISLCRVGSSKQDKSDGDFGANLVSQMNNEANSDQSVDEEYEDLRTELLAYQGALASLSPSRKSMMSTACWELGGLCVTRKLCAGFRSLTEVPGCKDKLNVCCFTWNRFNVRDMTDKGMSVIAMPWSLKQPYGGEGVKEKEVVNEKKAFNKLLKNKIKLKKKNIRTTEQREGSAEEVALIIQSPK